MATLLSTIGQKTRNRSSIHRRTTTTDDDISDSIATRSAGDSTQLISASALRSAPLDSTSLISTKAVEEAARGIRLNRAQPSDSSTDSGGQSRSNLESTTLIRVIGDEPGSDSSEGSLSDSFHGLGTPSEHTMLLVLDEPPATVEGLELGSKVVGERIVGPQSGPPPAAEPQSVPLGQQQSAAEPESKPSVGEARKEMTDISPKQAEAHRADGESSAPASASLQEKAQVQGSPAAETQGSEKAPETEKAGESAGEAPAEAAAAPDARFRRRDVTDAINIIVDEQREAVEKDSKDEVVPPRTGGKSGAGMLGWVLLLLVLGVGWFLFNQGSSVETPKEVADKPPQMQKRLNFSEALTQLGMTLPQMRGADPTECTNFLVVSSSDAKSSLGPIEGVSGFDIKSEFLAADTVGSFIVPLMTALRTVGGKDDSTLCVSLASKGRARDVFRILRTAHRAKLRRVGLAVRRIEEPGSLGVFLLETQPSKVPAVGEAHATIDAQGTMVWLQGRDGEKTNITKIPNRKPGQLSLTMIDKAFDQFTATHPLVRTVVLEMPKNTPLGTLELLVERARTAQSRERFTRIRLKLK